MQKSNFNFILLKYKQNEILIALGKALVWISTTMTFTWEEMRFIFLPCSHFSK